MKAVVTVASMRRLGNVMLLMASMKRHYPEYERIAYILDADEEWQTDECRLIPARSMFAQGYEQLAFAYTEEDFEQVVTMHAADRLLRTYSAVLMCDWGVEMRDAHETLQTSYPPDTALYLVDSSAQIQPPVNERFLFASEHPRYTSPAWLLTQGENTRAYTGFCCKKAEYLASLGLCNENALGYEIYEIKKHVVFYKTWHMYAETLGCHVEYARFVNLSMAYSYGFDALPLYAFIEVLHQDAVVRRNIRKLEQYAEGLAGKTQTEYYTEKIQEYYSAQTLARLEDYEARAAKRAPAQPYRYASFEDGTPVLEMLRVYYAYNVAMAEKCGENPFSEAAMRVMLDTNVLPGDTSLLVLNAAMLGIWHMRQDVQAYCPDVQEDDRLQYTHWYLENGAKEFLLPPAYLAAAEASIDAFRQRTANAAQARSFVQKLRDKLASLRGRPVHIAANNYAAPSMLPGVNLCGFIRGDFGVAEAMRILAKSLEAAGIPFTIVNEVPRQDLYHTYNDHSWDHKISNQFIYNTNILFTNADGTTRFINSVARQAIQSRYNIGFWYWELGEFPEWWKPNFDLVDEVWTGSEFTAQSFRNVTQKPVHVVPCCVEVGEIAPLGRKDFGIKEDAFVFLMMYDALSSNLRKNPNAILKAFLSRFRGNPNVQLVIKVSALETWNFEDELSAEAREHSNIIMLTGTYPRAKVNALLNCCDAFVSLHRSEGFGLAPAEAMYLGKPAVLTNWSGNTQYMTQDNCCPVQYSIVEIQDNFGEYKRGRHWAEPDIECAAAFMQRLVEDKDFYNSVAEKGRQTIVERFSARATGEIAKQRLQELGRL